MRILYLHQYFNTPQDAGGIRSYEMARRFVERGYEVHMITSKRNDGGKKGWFTTVEAGIKVHWLPVPYSSTMSVPERVRSFVSFAMAAGPRAASVGGDVVFATSTPLTIALPAVFAARRLRVPMVFEVRDLWPEMPIAIGALRNPVLKWVAHRLERFAYHNSDQIVALSPGMREGVVRTGYPRKKVHVIPNSSDVSIFRGDNVDRDRFLSRHPYLKGKKLVGYTGAVGPINGLEYFLRMASEMQGIDHDVHFLVVDKGGSEGAAIREAAAESGILDRNLTILPSVPKQELPDVLAALTVASSLFIDLPEMWSNSANKFFDALAAGKPVMINYAGWQAELLREYEAGIVVPPKDPIAAAQQLYTFLQNKEGLERAGLASAKLAETMFDRDLLAGKLLNVIEDTVGGQ